jgi:pimeloyl-ACP methyl ester carboxylesterase
MRREGFVVLVVLALLAACGVQVEPTSMPEPTATWTPVPTETPTPVLSGLVDVGGHSLYIDCIGEGTPTVVLDSRLGQDHSLWREVIALIEDSPPARVCGYDRLWLGMSRLPNLEVEKAPRTSQDMADDLHALLVNANIPGPYVLVGHSAAGFTARLYASQYPKEVVGMVLVDASHPDYDELALLPPESADESPALRKLRQSAMAVDPMQMPEYCDWQTSCAQVRAAGSLGDIPLVVLTRDVINPERQLALRRQFFWRDFPAELNEILEREWLALQEELAELSSNSTHIIVEDSSHLIPTDRPDSVVDAILKVLGQVESE